METDLSKLIKYSEKYCDIYLLYVLKLLTLPGTTKQKTPHMGRKYAKSHQTFKSVAGYKWSQKVAIFGKVEGKGLT